MLSLKKAIEHKDLTLLELEKEELEIIHTWIGQPMVTCSKTLLDIKRSNNKSKWIDCYGILCSECPFHHAPNTQPNSSLLFYTPFKSKKEVKMTDYLNSLPEDIKERILIIQEKTHGKRDWEQVLSRPIAMFDWSKTDEGPNVWRSIFKDKNIQPYRDFYAMKNKENLNQKISINNVIKDKDFNVFGKATEVKNLIEECIQKRTPSVCSKLMSTCHFECDTNGDCESCPLSYIRTKEEKESLLTWAPFNKSSNTKSSDIKWEINNSIEESIEEKSLSNLSIISFNL